MIVVDNTSALMAVILGETEADACIEILVLEAEVLISAAAPKTTDSGWAVMATAYRLEAAYPGALIVVGIARGRTAPRTMATRCVLPFPHLASLASAAKFGFSRVFDAQFMREKSI